MRRGHFLGAMMASRMLMVFGEMILLLAFGWLVFGMVVQGPIWIIALLSLLGAFVFSGLMNLVMLPMFVASGIFFSSERFPAVVQPLVKALPLTALNDALRAVILEGADLSSQWARLLLLAGWGAVSFFLALRVFRWS